MPPCRGDDSRIFSPLWLRNVSGRLSKAPIRMSRVVWGPREAVASAGNTFREPMDERRLIKLSGRPISFVRVTEPLRFAMMPGA